MLRSLLIGVNGSSGSGQAIELALKWAQTYHTPVTCLGVVDVEALTAPEPIPMGAAAFKVERDANVVTRERAQVAQALQSACAAAQTAGVECHLLQRDGCPADALGTEAERHDLVVLGRRSLPQSDREPAPSTTLVDILRQASRPVVVAGTSCPDVANVVMAYDGSAQAARTLQAFVQSGLHYGHPLHLVGIGDEPLDVQAKLMRALDYVKTHGRNAELHVLPVRQTVAATLAQFVRQLPCGLLVMGVYGQPRLKELLFGSVTSAILRDIPAPLFLHH